jgi:hypothetical protein
MATVSDNVTAGCPALGFKGGVFELSSAVTKTHSGGWRALKSLNLEGGATTGTTSTTAAKTKSRVR